MPRQADLLTVAAIRAAIKSAQSRPVRLSKRGTPLKEMLSDGKGLYVQINNHVPSWLYRYTLDGKTGWMGLGPIDLNNIDLAAARARAGKAREQKLTGVNPLEHKRTARQTQQVAAAKKVPTFAECAKDYFKINRAKWKNAKHATQWIRSLEQYVFPIIGHLPVDTVDTTLVLQVLLPIWVGDVERKIKAIPVTASRTRERMQRVLAYARTAGYRPKDSLNPARWEEHLEDLLPALGEVHIRVHQRMLPHIEIGVFMAALRKRDSITARALEFLILTAARTEEVLGVTWDEIDWDARMWIIPAWRHKTGKKTGKEKRLPLSDAAMAVLNGMAAIRDDSGLIFPGEQGGHLNHQALRREVERLGYGDKASPHGFRATFRTWGTDCTKFDRDILRMALGHKVGDDVDEAYQRGDGLAKRHRLAQSWAQYCNRPRAAAERGKVIPIRGEAA